jgi:hypothetical protein
MGLLLTVEKRSKLDREVFFLVEKYYYFYLLEHEMNAVSCVVHRGEDVLVSGFGSTRKER